jgi:hypothetical protein
MTINKISLSASAITRTLATVAFLLVLASVAGQISKFVFGHGRLKGLVVLFDVNYEGNIPTSYSVLLLLIAALLLAVIATLHRKQKAPHASKWAVLSFGFLLMAFDEAFSFHEMLIPPIRAAVLSEIPVASSFGCDAQIFDGCCALSWRSYRRRAIRGPPCRVTWGAQFDVQHVYNS